MSESRIIKKYPNRRLYDTVESRYITLADIRRLVIERIDFTVFQHLRQRFACGYGLQLDIRRKTQVDFLFAAGFFQSGDMWSLHFIAPQFLAWFYPANAEIFHLIGTSLLI